MLTILLVLFLLALSAFFSSSETAFFSLNTLRLEKLKKRDRSALRIELLKDKPDQLLATILLGNMFVNIFLSSLSAVIFVKYFGPQGIVYSVIITTVMLLLFGEILPKTIAYYSAERLALIVAPIMDILNSIFYPLSSIVIHISRSMFKILFKKTLTSEIEEVMTEEELKMALEQSVRQGVIEEDIEDMIQSVLAFSDIEAQSVMTPRPDVSRLNIDEDLDKIEGFLRSFKHSYIPVFEKNIDNIIGVLRTKDYFLGKGKIKDILLEPYFIPESKKIDDLMRELLVRKQKIAIVVDEHGGFSGIVTQEDIQEEIFGEIYDEYESAQKAIVKLGSVEFLVAASTSVADINRELELNLPNEDSNLAGLILDRLERFPHKGESFAFDGVQFCVESCTKRRILKVNLKILSRKVSDD